MSRKERHEEGNTRTDEGPRRQRRRRVDTTSASRDGDGPAHDRDQVRCDRTPSTTKTKFARNFVSTVLTNVLPLVIRDKATADPV